MNTSKLSKEEVLNLKIQLPHGAMKEIADELGLSRQYVSSVLNNTMPYNQQVVKKTIEFVERFKKEGIDIRERFEKLTK